MIAAKVLRGWTAKSWRTTLWPFCASMVSVHEKLVSNPRDTCRVVLSHLPEIH
jgi:hypothetical protein